MNTTETAGTEASNAGDAEAPAGMPTPDPALQRLEPMVGTWKARGHFVGSNEENIVGTITFSWLPGGFFLQQEIELDLAGQVQVQSLELIGYDAEAGTLSSQVYSNMSPVPLPYQWDMQGNELTISVSYGPLDATFKGVLSDDGRTFSGGWRPNPGADPAINAPYDIVGERVD